jgi:hypothetical protein
LFLHSSRKIPPATRKDLFPTSMRVLAHTFLGRLVPKDAHTVAGDNKHSPDICFEPKARRE